MKIDVIKMQVEIRERLEKSFKSKHINIQYVEISIRDRTFDNKVAQVIRYDVETDTNLYHSTYKADFSSEEGFIDAEIDHNRAIKNLISLILKDYLLDLMLVTE